MFLSQTLDRLQRGRAGFAAAFPPNQEAGKAAGDRLSVLEGDFANPGNLRGRVFVPAGLSRPMPLLAVLHGCTQNAAGYDRGAGWSVLAERHGFALLYPEQNRDNNPNLCFNWYQRSDATRGVGEAASIAGMIAAMRAAHPIDPGRVFVTGLSAGGAMAAVMLATYPELFAAGAIIAGLPYGCAGNLAEAFDCMAGRGFGDSERLAGKVRSASPHKGAWPRLSVWQGSADRTVAPANADALVRQWTALHGLAATPDRVDQVDGHPRRVWQGRDGRELVEHYSVEGMAHGTPLMPGTRAGESGEAGAHMLDVGLSSTDRIAAFFGLAPAPAASAAKPAPASAQLPGGKRIDTSPRPRPVRKARPARPAPAAVGSIQATIEAALRSAGLLR